MPSVSKADAFLLVLVVTSSILTTTVVVAASSATTVGDTNDLSLVRKIKNSKKQDSKNTNEDDTCTMEPFVGTSQYTNCEGTEMEVDIACAKKGNAAADGIPTKKSCSYSEQPVQYDDAVPPANTTAGCGDHGSFDPETHLIRDHAAGVCRLKFLHLTSTCFGAPVKRGFGVMVEVASRTGTGTGPGAHNHHGPNEDKNPKDNSGLLLRFSIDEGVTYYSDLDPRITVPLGTSSPQRKLTSHGACYPAYGTFGGNSTITWTGEKDFFQTCYKYGSDDKYCWSDSYSVIYEDSLGASTYYQNIPNHDGWHAIDANNATSFRLALGYGVEWYSIDTIKLRLATLASLCKTKCQDVYEKTRYPGGMCPPVSPTDYFRGYRYGYPYGFTTSNQQTCFRYYTGYNCYNQDCELVYSEDKYCWTNSYQYLALELHADTESRGLYTACFPVHEEGCDD